MSVGLLKGRYVKLKALSHTEKTDRKMQLVQDIESVMEESLDQDLEVVHPSGAEATYVSRAARQLATRHGPTTVLTLPLREDGEPRGALTVERAAEEPITAEEAEALRLTCDLVAPRLLSLAQTDRWAGARAASAVRTGAAALVGPKHTWMKLAAMAVFGFVLFLVFAKGTYTADADFTILPQKRRVVAAPYQGTVRAAYVEPGDRVIGAARPSWRLDEAEEDVQSWPALRKALAAPRGGTSRAPAAAQADGVSWALAAARRPDPGAPPDWAAVERVLGPLPAGDADEMISPATRVRRLLPAAVRADLDAAGPDGLSPAQRKAVLGALDALLLRGDLYSERAWAALEPTDRQADLLADLRDGWLDEPHRIELNRALLVVALPRALTPGPTVLAEMDTLDVRDQLYTARQELVTYRQRKLAAQAERKTGEAQLYAAQEKGAAKQIELYERRLREARLVAAISGQVAQGDRRDLVGREVQRGDVLFEVAQVDTLRAELAVPEDQIREIEPGQTGELATKSYPGISLPFTVERISPSAEVKDGENIFRVRASLDGQPKWLLPGMEGLARVKLDERRYAYIWTRKFVDWVRMKLWW